MRIVFLGTGDFAVPALRALLHGGHTVVCAISQPDRPSGRGKKIKPTPVHAACDELHVPHVQTEDVNAEDCAALIAGAELGVVAAFGQKIGRAWLDALPRGCINIHGSLLPKYRGAAPFQWAVLNGERETGVTIFQLDEKWDAGPIWSRRAIPIGDTETADELHDRLATLGAELIAETLPRLAAGELTPIPQDASQSTRAPKLSKQLALMRFDRPADELARQVCGLWSWPAATCEFVARDGRVERLQLARAAAASTDETPTPAFAPGAFLPDLSVQTASGRLRLLEVKPAGGKLMPFDAFANGRNVAPPDALKPIAAS